METMKLPLETRPFDTKHGLPWASCLPFVENSRGTLIHRPRHGATYNLHDKPHIGVTFWCGMAVSSSKKILTFLGAPPDNKILCERCEAAAIKAGMPSADTLAGRHVHKGRTVAVVTCCAITSEDKSDCHGPDWTERDGDYLK